MAREVLDHGVVLPAEYSDDWYEDMTSNLTKLDDVIGSDSEKLNADGVYFLRMSSAALTDSGTGNFSDLNSSYKIKTGDLVLDSGRKLYRIVSVDSTNETFTVGNSLFKVTAESDLAPVAESGDYDDLTDLPTYGITRYCSSAITDNSSIAFSAISSTNKIKVGDFLLDINGKMYQISAVDTTNQAVTVGSALVDIALDANVMHLTGDETSAGKKTFSDYATFNSYLYFTNSSVTKGTIPQITVSPYRIYFGSGVNYDASLFNIDTSVSNTGVQTLTFRAAENVVGGDDTRMLLIYDPNRTQPRYLSLKGDIEPNANNTYECGSSTNKLKNLHAYHGYFYGVQKGDEFSTNARTELTLLANRDTLGKSCAYITCFRQNRAQGDMQPLDLHMIGFDVVENEVRTNNVFSIQCTDWLNDVPQRVNIVCRAQSYSYGNSANKALFNDLNPGALSFPDLSSGLDISGYITDLTGASNINKFTPTVNGWISIGLSNADFIELYIPSSLIGGTFTKSTINGYAQAFLPVIANKEVRIALKGSSIGWAKFYPNLGNV